MSIYVQDYGAPIGLRLASRHPERVQALIVQNGNAYMDGCTPMSGNRSSPTPTTGTAKREAPVRGLLAAETIKWLWTHGTRDPNNIAPETWTLDAHNLDVRGNQDIQLDIFYDYGSNPGIRELPALPPQHQPPTLIAWGSQRRDLRSRRRRGLTGAICRTRRCTSSTPDTLR